MLKALRKWLAKDTIDWDKIVFDLDAKSTKENYMGTGLSSQCFYRSAPRWKLIELRRLLEAERQKLIFPFSFRKKGIKRGQCNCHKADNWSEQL